MERHLPYGITQCYLPPDTSERYEPVQDRRINGRARRAMRPMGRPHDMRSLRHTNCVRYYITASFADDAIVALTSSVITSIESRSC